MSVGGKTQPPTDALTVQKTGSGVSRRSGHDFFSSSDLIRNRVKIDYIVSYARNDHCPYLKVSVYSYEFLGLLDLGYTKTVIGWEVLKNVCVLNPISETCSLANGRECEIRRFIRIPVNNKIRYMVFKYR